VLQSDITAGRANASITFFFLYEAIFAVGWLPIPWLYAPEIMPLQHRTHSAAGLLQVMQGYTASRYKKLTMSSVHFQLHDRSSKIPLSPVFSFQQPTRLQITPVSIANISWKTYMMFFVLSLVFAVVVFLLSRDE
jgi:hypothetical protein